MRVVYTILLFLLTCHQLFSQLPQGYSEFISRSNNENPTKLILEIEDSDLNGDLKLLLKAELTYYSGNNGQAEEFADSLLAILDAKSAYKSYAYSRGLNLKALISWNDGQINKASDQLNQALSILNGLSAPKEILAEIYINMGLILSIESPEKARNYYNKALKALKDKDDQREKRVYTTINIALIDLSDGLADQSLNRLQDILKEWKSDNKEANPIEAFLLLNIGNSHLKRSKFTLAQNYFDDAISIYSDFYGERNSELANAYMLMSTSYLEQNLYKEALIWNDKAEEANTFGNSDKGSLENNIIKIPYQIAILTQKADIYEKYHYGYSLKKEHILSSLKSLKQADELITVRRKTVNNKVDQLALNKLASEIYQSAQRLCIYLDDITLFKNDYLEQAFIFSEKSKANALLNAVTESNAKSFSSIPPQVLDKEYKIKNDISFYTSQLAKTSKPELQNKYRNDLFRSQQIYEKFIEDLEKNYPAYYQLKYSSSFLQTKEIQAQLDTNEALISYSMDEESNRIYRYYITQDDFHVAVIYQLDQVQKNIKAFRNILTYQVKAPYNEIAFQLYEQLLPKKVKPTLDVITIIPDGALGIIPFEALLYKESEEKTYQKLPFLIRKKAIRYDYSATLHFKDQAFEYDNNSLIVAPVNFGQPLLSDLNATESEANELDILFKENGLRSTLLIKQEAQESYIKEQNMNSYRFVHFATHGKVNSNAPDQSAIFFNSTKTDQEDGSFYVGEIYNAAIKTELLCLSACETGIGKISKGEGVLGLGRAFKYAGANKLLVSYWQVNDKSTAIFMNDFYKNIFSREIDDHSINLQTTKIKMINGDYSSPYYWAPFVLWGN